MPVFQFARFEIRPEACADAERAMHELASYVRKELPDSSSPCPPPAPLPGVVRVRDPRKFGRATAVRRRSCAFSAGRTALRVAQPLLAWTAMPVVNTDLVAIATIMTRAAVTARGEATIASLIALMTQHHIGCVPIVDDQDRPTGIVTKLDLLECQNDGRKTAREVMMPNAMTLPAEASIARAAELMSSEGIHHVLVVNPARALLGVVSTFDVTRWLAQASQ